MLLRQKQWQENESNPYTSRNTGGHAREADRERRCPTSPANGMQTSLCNMISCIAILLTSKVTGRAPRRSPGHTIWQQRFSYIKSCAIINID